jgi:hypothetical protein
MSVSPAHTYCSSLYYTVLYSTRRLYTLQSSTLTVLRFSPAKCCRKYSAYLIPGQTVCNHTLAGLRRPRESFLTTQQMLTPCPCQARPKSDWEASTDPFGLPAKEDPSDIYAMPPGTLLPLSKVAHPPRPSPRVRNSLWCCSLIRTITRSRRSAFPLHALLFCAPPLHQGLGATSIRTALYMY